MGECVDNTDIIISTPERYALGSGSETDLKSCEDKWSFG
jgi:hypothetical protein